MEMYDIKEDVKKINGFKEASNELKLKIFDILFIIEDKNRWEDLNYYKNAPELRKYATTSFEDILKDVFKVSYNIYTKMKQVMEIPKGRKLLSTKGWSRNMATFLNRSASERIEILNAIENGDTRDIYDIHRSIHPKVKEKVEKIDNGWKSKYQKLAKEHANAKKRILELEKQEKIMKNRLAEIANMTKVMNG